MNENKSAESGSEDDNLLFLRGESESNSDDWDDSELISVYDKAVEKTKLQVLKKLQSEKGLSKEELQEVFSDINSEEEKKKRKKKKNKNSDPKWTVGSYCRAIYKEDKEEYEAEILEIVKPNKCVVNFIGYNNQEEVFLSDLRPSYGPSLRNQQIRDAENETAMLQNTFYTEREDFIPLYTPRNQQYDYLSNTEFTRVARDGGNKMDEESCRRHPRAYHAPTPPPPPLPTMRLNTMDDEALNSMLMSWYMCGYYTGYYQQTVHNSENRI